MEENARWYEATGGKDGFRKRKWSEAGSLAPLCYTEKLGPGVEISKCNLVGKDLSNLDLTGAFIHDADLSYADLQGTTLVNSTLQRVEFTEAKVQNADFEDSTVNGGNLQLAIFCNTTMPAGNIASGNC